METLLKLFLSLSIIVFISCSENTDYVSEKNRNLAEKIWQTLDNHKILQGSPESNKLIDSILFINPNNCDALREKSVPFLKRGLLQLWKPMFDEAVECDPKAWVPWRGYLYLFFYRDYDKAIADFNASDTLTPNYVDAPQGQSVNYWRGLAYLGKKDYQNSIKYFETHIAIETKESGEDWVETSTFLYLGIDYFELKNYEKAIQNLNKNIKYSEGNSADAYYYLAKISFETKNYKEAKEYIEKAMDDFDEGYFQKNPYVEVIRQIYIQDLEILKKKIEVNL